MKARVLVSQNRTDEALRIYNEVLEAEPDNALAHADRGTLFAMLKQFTHAINDLRQAIAPGYIDSSAYSTIATVHLELKEFRTSLEYFDKAIELNPNYPFIYYNRASIYQELGDNDAAIADLEKCLEFGPDQNLHTLIMQRLNMLRSGKPL